MNTDRDNFYDWAKDRPDSTSFSGLGPERSRRIPARSSNMLWGRWVVMAAMTLAAVACFKLLLL